MSFGDGQRRQMMMASASLIPMICPHSVDQRIDRDLVAVRQEEILPNTHWCIAEFGRYVLIHETVPYFTQATRTG